MGGRVAGDPERGAARPALARAPRARAPLVLHRPALPRRGDGERRRRAADRAGHSGACATTCWWSPIRPRAGRAAAALSSGAARPTPACIRPRWSGRAPAIAPSASVGAYVVVGEGATIGDRAPCSIPSSGRSRLPGRRRRRAPSARRALSGHEVGERVVLHAGAVLGADGFGYIARGGRHLKVPQVGVVVLEDEVEIGANSTIDRATLDETRVGAGTKIDNLVQVGHNVRIGRSSILCGQAGIAGSATSATAWSSPGSRGSPNRVDHRRRGARGGQVGGLRRRGDGGAGGRHPGDRSVADGADRWPCCDACPRCAGGWRRSSGVRRSTARRAATGRLRAGAGWRVSGGGDGPPRRALDRVGAAAPLSDAAGRPRARDRAEGADRRDQERHRQRELLRRPLPGPAGDARRAAGRGHGAGRRHPAAARHPRPRPQAALLHVDRAGALPPAGGARRPGPLRGRGAADARHHCKLAGKAMVDGEVAAEAVCLSAMVDRDSASTGASVWPV